MSKAIMKTGVQHFYSQSFASKKTAKGENVNILPFLATQLATFISKQASFNFLSAHF